MSKMGNRVRVIRDNYRMAKENDPKLGWILLGIVLLGIAFTVGVIAAFGNPWTWSIVGFSATLVILSIVFSRRAMRSAYRSI
jgi:Flp pilus assembly protein TadB